MIDSNKLRNQVIYQIFVRQYGANHSFRDVYNDLDRIKELGTDIIYLMPIFPIGKLNRKGSLGSPYSIYDYTKIDEYLGGEKELKKLIDKTHEKGMRIIFDVALNHTSCDATLLQQNENYYYHKDGKVSRKCEDWSDVLDLDYNNLELHDILIKDMCNLIKLGFDGFRMDVCSLIPMVFWRKLYKELIKINEDVIMVGESVEPSFLEYIRTLGVDAPDDLDLYEVFDTLYQYDINDSWNKMKNTKLLSLNEYLSDVLKQNKIFSKPKLRYLENHNLSTFTFGRGLTWLDTGTQESLAEATFFVKMIETHQGLKISCLEEIAYKNGWISKEDVLKQADKLGKSEYGQYLKNIV